MVWQEQHVFFPATLDAMHPRLSTPCIRQSHPPPHSDCVLPYCYSQVDERFRVDQQNLEQTIVEIIRAIIRDRTARHERADVDDRRRDYRRRSGGAGISRASGRPRKVGQAFATASAVAIDSLVRSQTRPGASLAAADWQAVVRYVYRGAPADAQTVGVLVKEAAMNHGRGGQGFGAGKGKSRQGRVGSRGSPVPFGFFLQVLLGYQLHGHLRCLRNFKEDFRKVKFVKTDDSSALQFRNDVYRHRTQLFCVVYLRYSPTHHPLTVAT